MILSRISNKLKRHFYKMIATKVPLSEVPHWLDSENALIKIENMNISEEIKTCLRSLHQNGFGILNKTLPEADCNNLIKSFRDFCATDTVAQKYKNSYGLHERLSNFHLVSKEAQTLLHHAPVVTLLKQLLGENPNLVGSLFFEKSTEQDFHRDTPAFFTNPINQFFGVWFALEDIDDTQGPLKYFVKSHRLKNDFEMRTDFRDSDSYQAELYKMAKESGLELQKFYAKKGDVLIWHPQLLHGGSDRTDKKRSRYSMVFHWMSEKCKIHSIQDFFNGENVFVDTRTSYIKVAGINAINHNEPKFFHDRKEGNFDEFN